MHVVVEGKQRWKHAVRIYNEAQNQAELEVIVSPWQPKWFYIKQWRLNLSTLYCKISKSVCYYTLRCIEILNNAKAKQSWILWTRERFGSAPIQEAVVIIINISASYATDWASLSWKHSSLLLRDICRLVNFLDGRTLKAWFTVSDPPQPPPHPHGVREWWVWVGKERKVHATQCRGKMEAAHSSLLCTVLPHERLHKHQHT